MTITSGENRAAGRQPANGVPAVHVYTGGQATMAPITSCLATSIHSRYTPATGVFRLSLIADSSRSPSIAATVEL